MALVGLIVWGARFRALQFLFQKSHRGVNFRFGQAVEDQAKVREDRDTGLRGATLTILMSTDRP